MSSAASQESWEELYHGAACGLVSTTPDGLIRNANRTFARWIGQELDDLVGVTRFPDLLGTGGPIYYETHIVPLLRIHGEVRELALEVTRSDGDARPVLVNATAIIENGTHRATHWTIIDARRRREALMLATWELELSTGAVEWSDGYHALYGVDPETFAPTREAFQEIMHPEDRELLTDAIEQIIRGRTAIDVRYRILRRSDGAERRICDHVRAERAADGAVLRVSGIAQDVTDLVLVLTPRESEMLMLLAEGLRGEEIAEQLFLSRATVRTHIQNAMAKLGAHSRGEAIAAALRSRQFGP